MEPLFFHLAHKKSDSCLSDIARRHGFYEFFMPLYPNPCTRPPLQINTKNHIFDISFALKMETINIVIPSESFALVESKDREGAVALMVINATLKHHKDDIPLKQVFGYYCSIIFDYDDVDENLWPSQEEFSIMHDYVETFDKALKVNDEHPNALFVARVTHKGTCQMIWMIHNAQTAIEYLDRVIAEGNQIREFEYSIEGDPEWSCIEWFLQDFPSKDQ